MAWLLPLLSPLLLATTARLYPLPSPLLPATTARLYPLGRHERGAPRRLVLLEGGVELGRVEVVVDVARRRVDGELGVHVRIEPEAAHEVVSILQVHRLPQR